jgi:flagellar hook-associated protein 2
MSNVSISGAISGLDTASLINSLMSVESQPQTQLKNKQTSAQAAIDAYGSLITSLKSLATQSAALAKTSTWVGSTATSSASSVTATATGNATGSLTFDVTSIAAAHTLISDGFVPSTGAVVAAGPTITVNDGSGAPKGTIAVGSGSLADVVSGINGSNLGLRAAAVQVAPGQYRLQVTSATSGSAAAFTLDGLSGFTGGTTGAADSMNLLTAGADAVLTIGKDAATQYTVSSATNTFADLVPGLSFTVSKAGETDVTVGSKLDGTAVATQIGSLVDATNKALDTLAASTAYDFTKKSGAALYGDSSIRSLQQNILSAVGSTSAPGVQLTRDGRLKFDQAAFLKAFQADPDAVASAYGAKSSFSPNTGVLGKATLLTSTDKTRVGAYAVQVSVAAAREKWSAASADLVGKTVVITQGSMTATYTVGVGESVADAVAALNTRAAAAGIGVTASVNVPNVIFTANTAGSSSAFKVTLDGTDATQVTAGRNVVGTIDGKTATGVGSTLSLNNAASGANGLSLDVDVSDADVSASGGNVGSVTYTSGLAQRLSGLLSDVTGSSGALTQSQASKTSEVKSLQDEIDQWDTRLAARRASLTTQFTAMETALAKLKSNSSAIAGLLTSTQSTSGSTS